MFKKYKKFLFFIFFIISTFFSKSIIFAEDKITAEEYIEVCNSCHGVNGASPIEPNIPMLAGQNFYYMYIQLKDLHSGLRKNEIMNPIASELDRDTMKAISKHYSEQPWPATNSNRKPTMSDKKIGSFLDGGQCTVCHMGQFQGNNSDVPRLANQNVEYLEKTMLDMKHKLRMNSPPMSSLMSPYTEDQIKAMAEYLSQL